jgi:lysophospholipase L1-like esterase
MKHFLTALLVGASLATSLAQDPLRFKKEIDEIKQRTEHHDKGNVVVFTGSSSIRLWSDIETRFKEFNVLNTGFGGSQTSDMFYYAEELITDYRPKQIFIYEGDNDLGEGKTPEQIISDTDKLVKYLRGTLSKRIQIGLITPKPSIRRWELKERYENYINLLRTWTATQKNVIFIDVWTPMLDERGNLKRDLFLEDDLHMNAKGYDIWTKVITPYLRKRYRKG